MGKAVEKLLTISSDSLSQDKVMLTPDVIEMSGSLRSEIEALLANRNGFFAFESALRVFPSCSSKISIGLDSWNSESLWRREYSDFAKGCLFFAEDIFGGQFCIKNDSIYSFDPETGALEEMAASMEQWAEEVLSEYNLWTGYQIAHEWQEVNGLLALDARLMPKIPFVCGGRFEINNLIAINAVSGMRSRGNLATQIANLVDGTQIEFKIVD